jgi:pimeloyl-ACP methyl ester carboxylesterase
VEKQDLLLLHGALGSQSQFQNLIPLLEEHFEIYTLDFSGHGDMPVGNDFGIITFANEVLYELAKWHIDKINIFGYSMGGYVATYLALNSDRVIKAFTLGTKFLWTPEYAEKETRKLDPAKIIEKVPSFAEEVRQRHKHLSFEDILSKTSRMMLDLGSNNLLSLDSFKNVNAEICVGIGDSDNTVGIDESVSVYHAIPRSKMCVLPNTLHPFEKVNPILLTESLKQFFK